METTEPKEEKFEQWGVLELMGHVRMAGRITEETRFGTVLGRIDIPQSENGFVTQYFGGGSVYRFTPTTEEIARAVAVRNQPEPVYSWEIKALQPPDESPRARPVAPDYEDADIEDDDPFYEE